MIDTKVINMDINVDTKNAIIESINELSEELSLDMSNENDRCWLAGYLRGKYNILKPSGQANFMARICLSLDVPKHQKIWAEELKL